MALKHRQKLRFIAAFAFATAAIFFLPTLSGCAGSVPRVGFYSNQSFTAEFVLQDESTTFLYERDASADTDLLTIRDGPLAGIVYTFSPSGDFAAYGGAKIPLKPSVSTKLKTICQYFKTGEESLLSVSSETVGGTPCTAAKFGNNSGMFTVYLSSDGIPMLILAESCRIDIAHFTVTSNPNDQ